MFPQHGKSTGKGISTRLEEFFKNQKQYPKKIKMIKIHEESMGTYEKIR